MAEADRPGAGRPRLVVAPPGGHAPAGSPEADGEEREFALHGEVTTIGSDEGQGIRLDGLSPQHAEVRWVAEGDEYVFVPLAVNGHSSVDGELVSAVGLHHGDRVEVGRWSLIFQRDEDSDHVRSIRSRQGGEYSGGGVHSAGGEHTEAGP